MSEFKGTPGPWSAPTSFGGRYVQSRGRIVAEATPLVGGSSEARANAKLIAASPALLHALQALVARIDYYASLPDRGEVNIEDWAYTAGSDDMNAARAALAKALGQ